MSAPARILHALAGAPGVDGCAPVEPCRCYMCAAKELTRTEFIESAVEERLGEPEK